MVFLNFEFVNQSRGGILPVGITVAVRKQSSNGVLTFSRAAIVKYRLAGKGVSFIFDNESNSIGAVIQGDYHVEQCGKDWRKISSVGLISASQLVRDLKIKDGFYLLEEAEFNGKLCLFFNYDKKPS